jgi:hypothetical protein
MRRWLRRLAVIAALVGLIAAIRAYLFSVNEKRYRDAFTPPGNGED